MDGDQVGLHRGRLPVRFPPVEALATAARTQRADSDEVASGQGRPDVGRTELTRDKGHADAGAFHFFWDELRRTGRKDREGGCFRLMENSLLHKSRAGYGEGAMVRVDRKCEAHV